MKKIKKHKHKSLCKLNKKEVEANIDELISMVNKPEFICCKCARVAIKESNLCNPKSISV